MRREEIEKRLQGVDSHLSVAFAARCSMRVLPLLVAEKVREPFGYWEKKDRPGYVLSLLTAQQVSIYFSVFGKRITVNRAALANNASGNALAAGARASYANAALAADTAAANALAADTAARPSFAATTAAVAATAAIRAQDSIKTEIQLDLDHITTSHSVSTNDFFYSPLWSNSIPDAWQSLFSRFNESILNLDAGFDIWVSWYQDRINGVPLDQKQEQLWLDIPPEIRELGAKSINAYLATLSLSSQEDSSKPSALKQLNLVRAIFIGNGAAGKTSLIRKLHGEDVVEGEEEMTPGIDIREWPVPSSTIKARFWDFGGQVMSHSTHQFFLRERCLYVLVVDAGSEREVRENQTANDQAEYWLEHVKTFGNNAPVMLVGNKSDQAKVNLDMCALAEKYSNIVGFYPISCTSKKEEYRLELEKFQTVFIEKLQTVGTHQVMFTQGQFAVLERVRQLSRQYTFLDRSTFDNLCQEHEIGKQGLDKTDFLGVLDALGEIIYFSDFELPEAYVLNPRWLTYGVYTLLYSNEVQKQQGILSHDDVVHILQAEKVEDEKGNTLHFPRLKCRFIIDAMIQYKLCYCLPGGNKQYVIPDKLPKEQPDLAGYFDKNVEGTLAFEFSFTGLLPRSIMPNLIVARHDEIVTNKQGNQLVWQRGVILRNKERQTTARWTVDYHHRCLRLWVQGNEAREYLVILRDSIHQILGELKGLPVRENVILPEFARIDKGIFFQTEELEKAPYDRLLKEAKRGQKITSSDSGADYDLQQVLGFIMTMEQQEKEQRKVEQHADIYKTIINIEKNIGVVGGVGSKHKTGNDISQLQEVDTPEKWCQEWWIITLTVALLAGVITGFAFKSTVFGAATFIIAALAVYIHNPKRRFNRAAWFVFSTAFYSVLPSFSGTMGFNKEMLDGKFGFLLHWGEPINPWFGFLLLILTGFLFWLDYKHNK